MKKIILLITLAMIQSAHANNEIQNLYSIFNGKQTLLATFHINHIRAECGMTASSLNKIERETFSGRTTYICLKEKK